MDWLDLLAVHGTLKSLLQHQSSKASILRCSAFFTVQLSHPYMISGKTIALTRRTFGAEVQPRLIQGIRRGDDFGEFTGYTGFNQILIRDIKSNRIRIAQQENSVEKRLNNSARR